METLKTQHTRPSRLRADQAAASHRQPSPPKPLPGGAETSRHTQAPSREKLGNTRDVSTSLITGTAGTRVWQGHIQLSQHIPTPSLQHLAKHPVTPLVSPLLQAAPGSHGAEDGRAGGPPITRLSWENIKTGIWRGNVTPGYYTM